MNFLTSPRNRNIIINLLLLLAIVIYLLQPLNWPVQLPAIFWIRQGGLLLIWVGLFYLITKFLIPAFLFKDKQPVFFGLFVSSIVFTVLVGKVLELALNYHEAMSAVIPFFARHSKYSVDTFMVFTTIFISVVSASIEIVRKWNRDNELRLQLEQEKTASELSFLKAQINPHFFFNTLNNIYALNKTNSEKAGDAIYTLSHMMRYILYDTHQDTTVKKEVQFIEDYIKLMELRLTDKVEVVFIKSGINVDHHMAPMFFLPYVENAFKHGISPSNPTRISIQICSDKCGVSLEVRNTLVEQEGQPVEESSGIGLRNTKRRLDLMYPGRYELNIDTHTAEKEYVVQLKLKL
jgi:two-component system, LytTR family, sensor kinase